LSSHGGRGEWPWLFWRDSFGPREQRYRADRELLSCNFRLGRDRHRCK
jgi:hypothetical protein